MNAGSVSREKTVVTVVTTIIISALSLTAHAQSASVGSVYPAKPIRMIVPFPPGGGNDILARTVGQRLSEVVNQQIIVDNRGGAGGALGAQIAVSAAPDGYTLFLGSVGNLAQNPVLQEKPAYDPVRDFAPVTLLATSVFALCVNNAVSAKSVQELIALAKAKPGALNFASAGSGTGSHLAAELFKSIAGVDIVHVPYKGGSPAMTDVIAGQVQLMFNGIPSSMPHLRSGRVRGLAVTTATRVPAAPELPTIAEAGFPGAESTSWTGILVPAGTPGPVIAKLQGAFAKALQFPDVVARLSMDGAAPVGNSAAEFGAYIKSELTKWSKVVKASGASAQ